MSNQSSGRPKSGTTQPRAPTHPSGKTRKQQLWGGFLAIFGLIASFIALLALIPRPLVSASDPLVQKDPFSSTITVSNNGFVPLDNVGYGIAIRAISTSYEGGISGAPDYSSLLYPDSGRGRHLGLDDKYQFPFNTVLDGDAETLLKGDFAILVYYEVPIVHWHGHKLFPLKVVKQEDGSFHWFAEPEPKHYALPDKGYRISGTIHLPHSSN